MTQVALPRRPSTRPAAWRPLGLGVVVGLLILAIGLSLAVGTRTIPLDQVWHLLLHPGDSDDGSIIRDLRLPRTVLAILVGASLAVAGVLMQALTRNPLADPGIFGIEAGAAAALVIGTLAFNTTGVVVHIWFAFLGAAVTTLFVYALSARGPSGSNPVRLALAGAAVAAALTSLVRGISLAYPSAFDQFRFWQVGSLSGHDLSISLEILPFVAVGLVIALVLGPSLNVVALGEEMGKGLGVNLRRTRALGAVAIVLLCGAATAAAGPIAFIGLVVGHSVRAFVGPDLRWVTPFAI